MARPTRQGVDYFSLDVHLDDKFKFVEIKYGLEGFAILVKLMQRVYSQGYWCNWTDDEKLLFSDEIRSNYETVFNVVNEAINRDVFDKSLYEKYEILTSRGIQKRYKEITRRRKGVEVTAEYLLVDGNFGIDDNIIIPNVGILSAECSHDDGRSTQSKVKESKVKESKQQQTTEAPKFVEEITEQKPVVVVDNDFAKLTNFYSENIGPLNKAIGDELGDMCDMMNPELALLALKEAVLANARNKIKYTNTILQSWKSQNFETAADVDQSEARRQAQSQHNKVASLFDASPETLERQRLDAEKYKDVVIDTSELPY